MWTKVGPTKQKSYHTGYWKGNDLICWGVRKAEYMERMFDKMDTDLCPLLCDEG